MANLPAFPHHRHQSSLEGIFHLSFEPPLEPVQRDQAKRKFYHIVNYFEAAESASGHPYNRPLLVRLTYEYSRSEESQDIFLRAFFLSVELSIDSDDGLNFSNTDSERDLRSALVSFAEHLFDHFFLPRKTRRPFVD
jgi:hypothetical protein